MIKKGIHILTCIILHISIVNAQQITTDGTQTPEELIQNVVGNNCAVTSNAISQFNGDINNIPSYGSFNNNNSNFPLESGFILSTGRVSNAGNSVNPSDLSDGELNWETDPDILEFVGVDQTLNATSLQFDLVSVNDFLAFKYVFASDEYQQEYPCNFRDVFAILVRRTNSTDPFVNIATIPDSDIEISTNTIHPEITGFCEANNEQFFEGYNIGSTNFNGHTTALTAQTNIIPGETYTVKFIIADHIDQRFDSAVFIEAESFGGAIDLGPDQSVCGTDLLLDANIDNPDATYQWFLNNNVVTGENNAVLQVSDTGTYRVEISLPFDSGSCILSDEIDVEVIPFQPTQPINDLIVCDPTPEDGTFDFDFPFLMDDEIYAQLPSTNYDISYHLSEDDALDNNNPISGIYQNSNDEETIFVRIESFDGSCLQIGSFDLSITSPPNITTLNFFLDICFDQITDVGITELNQFDVVMSNSELNRVVTYYMTEEDAINRINAIDDFPDFNLQPPRLVARVEVVGATDDCFSLAYLNFNYLSPPELGVDQLVLSACEDPEYSEVIAGTLNNYDNVPVTFDIEAYFDYIENTLFPGSTVSTLELYGLGNPRSLTLTNNNSFTMRLGIAFENANCQREIPLIVHKNLLFNVIGNDSEFFLCDDPSGDGIVDFNLENVADDLKNGYNNIQIQFYLTENDRDLGLSPLDQTLPITVTNEQTLYIRSNFEDCQFDTEVTLKINPPLIVTDFQYDYCGFTNTITNATSIVLEPIRQNIINDVSLPASVEFYESPEDAELQTNIISEDIYELNLGQELYVRVTNLLTECFDVAAVQLNIASLLNDFNPEPIIVCDEDQNLVATVNLETVLDNINIDTSNISFTFHNTFENASSEFFEFLSISSPDNYNTTSSEIFLRVGLDGSNCYTVFNFDVLIYADPQLDEINSYINCEDNPNQPSDFFFESRNTEIIDGQEGMQVLYFETELDATTRQNPIDQTIAYQNTSNPQIIYVRLENEIENGCFKIVPMQIEVRQSPDYNPPSDVFECDIFNNGLVTTDLSSKVDEIIVGSTTPLNVSFHLSPLNANLGTNAIPLNFNASSNPQLLYARIENSDTECYNVETFTLNVLSLPEVNTNQSLVACGDNYNTNLEWDLTDIELDILDGRQYNIAFAYYNSFIDAETNSNEIESPTNYINTVENESIFLKVENLTTGCYSIVSFSLIINPAPQINPIETFEICDTVDNTFDLSEINSALLDVPFNVIVSYYTNATDAEAGLNPLNDIFTYTSDIQSLVVRAEFSTTGCFATHPFELVVLEPPVATQPDDIILCDDNNDGFLEVNLSNQNENILNDLNPEEFSVTYFNIEENANNNIIALDEIYNAFNGQTIFARLEDINTGCFDITEFNVIINPLPEVIIEDQLICLDNLPLVVSAYTGNNSDSYVWSTNEISSNIEIIEAGSYSVTITNEFGCSSTSSFNVTESESANIDVVETIDFSDPNNIILTVSGIGDYLYQLNDLIPQESNVFNNVPIGYNTITITDINGCAQTTREVLVLDTPKHMTPNGDGDFDQWHIAGVETLPGTVIHIFDRFGKLLTVLKHNTPGWDGTYNGNKMPSGDYWYIADVIKDGERFEIKGHFALKR
ncbi:MAG: T9SS type B sorting domain-containing protein [Winogradskyella sp.]|uniref:T9SS type B sorting domain-containing protein n=1 Tax=Winogradskyella sp. TaxID=1883156 RepID=UPI0025F039A1|nr:T9SS type B sorting domain-containing protein [Winogradskyella sp.]NRB58528.1 T9SS type B sorting domain-containing protein [Winogradskyella sp.]